jgi:antitoxin component HigA of HigAB toxin-antitoxin module
MIREPGRRNNLKQSGLPEIGRQGVTSEILSGKRQFNVCQIRLLIGFKIKILARLKAEGCMVIRRRPITQP